MIKTTPFEMVFIIRDNMILDKIKAEWQKIRELPSGTRNQYFLDYWKWPVIGILIAISFAGYILTTSLLNNDAVLTGVMLNSSIPLSGEDPLSELADDFMVQNQINPEKEKMELIYSLSYFSGKETSTSDIYYSLQSLSALIIDHELDFVTGNITAMESLAYADYFDDLRAVLNEEQIAKYEAYFLYIDMAIMKQMQQTDWSGEDPIVFEFPDCSNPELMEDPVPVFIDMSTCTLLESVYPDNEETLVFAFATNSRHTEMAVNWLNYTMISLHGSCGIN